MSKRWIIRLRSIAVKNVSLSSIRKQSAFALLKNAVTLRSLDVMADLSWSWKMLSAFLALWSHFSLRLCPGGLSVSQTGTRSIISSAHLARASQGPWISTKTRLSCNINIQHNFQFHYPANTCELKQLISSGWWFAIQRLRKPRILRSRTATENVSHASLPVEFTRSSNSPCFLRFSSNFARISAFSISSSSFSLPRLGSRYANT